MVFLGIVRKRRILDIIADAKVIIPYEKIVEMNLLSLTPENSDFFEKTEFYSDLKKKAVSDVEYECLFFLFKTLKMIKFRRYERPLQCPRRNFTLPNSRKPILIHA